MAAIRKTMLGATVYSYLVTSILATRKNYLIRVLTEAHDYPEMRPILAKGSSTKMAKKKSSFVNDYN